MTVTELGSEGSGLDHLVLMFPILARYTFPALIEKPPIECQAFSVTRQLDSRV
jgi:hypothetical protein